ncbi:MAG TPA: FAD-binding protein [Burkholderiales bacterium]|nr:FAD-binding protein [Burkholderiales bacterium]
MSRKPLSAAELCDAVRQGRAVEAACLDRILCSDAERGIIEVQAATPWRSLATRLRADETAPPTLLASARATVGDSVAANVAGPDGRPAVLHVEALTLVTADGELRRLSRKSDAELFSLAIGGHGLFGTFYSITLRIESLARALEQARAPQSVLLRPGRQAARPLELLLPPEALEVFVSGADALCAEWGVPLRSVTLRRTSAEADTFLRWASREFVQVELQLSACEALGEHVRSTQVRRAMIDAAIAAGGAFPIVSTREATREQTQACYPQLQAFLAHKRRFDPHEKLTNEWYRHQRSVVEQCVVRWSH